MKKIFKIFLCFTIFILFTNQVLANIDLISSPFKYELQIAPGENITHTAKLYNREGSSLIITTGKSNIDISETGQPILVDVGNPNQEMASWITIGENSFTIDANGTYTINFTIDVPGDAVPGGHYGVVYFEYKPDLNATFEVTQTIKIGAKYGVLLLVTVDGEIIDNGNVGDTEITPGGSGGAGPGGYYIPPKENNNNQQDDDLADEDDNLTGDDGLNAGENPLLIPPIDKIDKCPYGDISQSNYDGKCIDDINVNSIIDYVKEKISGYDRKGEDETILNSAFEIDFSVPIENKGNTHIKPSGKIILIDEDGNEIKKIGVEDIIDSNGVKIGEKIVDYIPINSEGSNILPNTDRYFKQIWRGFPYYALDENGDRIIEYRTPSEYYAMQYKNIFDVLYPWQRIYNILNQKKIKAITNISYTNYYGEEVSFNSEKDFYVEYEVEVIGYDPFFFIVLGIILIILWFFLILWKRVKKKKCPECGKWIEKKLKVCPYCGINLKTLEILSEKETTNTKRKIPKKQVKSISKTKKTTSKKS